MTPARKPLLFTPKKVVLASVLTLVLLALFAYFVWPTPYRTWKGVNAGTYRVNRFTRQVEYEIGDGWHVPPPEDRSVPPPGW